MNETQRELGRHALGLPTRNKKSYRNHFVAGKDHSDYPEWMKMVEQGDATRRDGTVLSGGADSVIFYLTRQGAEQCLDPHEKLAAEDFPK